jgi:hypothetical protein
MKITIEYDHEDDALEALNARKYLSAIEEADNYLRSCLKHGDNTEAVKAILEFTRERLRWQE